jgi:hypothetical protein
MRRCARSVRGDLVFSFVDTRILAVGIAQSYCWESPKPLEFGTSGQNWENIGWRVAVRFTELVNKIRPKDHIEILRPLLPERYAPLQPNGNGLQSVYLTELPRTLAEMLIGLIGDEMGEPPRHHLSHFHSSEETAGGDGWGCPSCPAVALAGSITGDAMADAIDAAEFLDIHVQQFARTVSFVADDCGSLIERAESPEAVPAQHETDGRYRPAEAARDHRAGQALAAKGEALAFAAVVEPGWTAKGPWRAISEARFAFASLAIAPFTNSARADAVSRGERSHGPSAR